jgi:hypothetical protein
MKSLATHRILPLLMFFGSTVGAVELCPNGLYSTEFVAGYSLPSFQYQVKPAGGVFYDPPQAGTGLTMDVFKVGGADYGFVTYYHYQADGRPTWMNLIAPIQQSSVSEYTLDGVPAKIVGRWAETNGGQCFDCAYTGFPPVNYPPHGERALTVRSGYQVDMPASGAAALREMRLGRALGDGQPMKGLLESGDVWQVKERYRADGVVGERNAGWIRFAKRTADKKWQYVAAPATTCVDNGSGVALPSQTPSWMNHSASTLNAIEQQYEARCVFSSSAAGSCAEFVETASSSRGTIFIDPSNQRAFLKQHCIGCTTGPSFFRDNAAVVQSAEVVTSGADRLVIRSFDAQLNVWLKEYELVRVPLEVVKLLVPNYTPSAN